MRWGWRQISNVFKNVFYNTPRKQWQLIYKQLNKKNKQTLTNFGIQ